MIVAGGVSLIAVWFAGSVVRPRLINRVPSKRSSELETIPLGGVVYEPAWWPVLSKALGTTIVSLFPDLPVSTQLDSFHS